MARRLRRTYVSHNDVADDFHILILTFHEYALTHLEVITTHPFRLLDLPSELQLRIFSIAVIEPQPLRRALMCGRCYSPYQDCYPECKWYGTIVLAFPPPLARVSRSIRHDVLKIFYSQHEFKILLRNIDNVGLALWLGNVAIEYRHLVKMRIVARKSVKEATFVEDMMAMLRTAGWDPVIGEHTHGSSLHLTFGAQVVEHT